jgi:hypothetical protein
MPDPEPWQTNAAAPFLQIEGSEVAVWSLGSGWFRVTAPGFEQEVEGYDAACELAAELAGRERASPPGS